MWHQTTNKYKLCVFTNSKRNFPYRKTQLKNKKIMFSTQQKFLHSKISLETSSFNFCILLPLIIFNYLRFFCIYFTIFHSASLSMCLYARIYTHLCRLQFDSWSQYFASLFSISISFYLFGEKKKMKLLKKNTQNKEEKFANYQKYTFKSLRMFTHVLILSTFL